MSAKNPLMLQVSCKCDFLLASLLFILEVSWLWKQWVWRFFSAKVLIKIAQKCLGSISMPDCKQTLNLLSQCTCTDVKNQPWIRSFQNGWNWWKESWCWNCWFLFNLPSESIWVPKLLLRRSFHSVTSLFSVL